MDERLTNSPAPELPSSLPGPLALAAVLCSLRPGEQIEIRRDQQLGRFEIGLRFPQTGSYAFAHLGEAQVCVYDDCDLARILRELLPILRAEYQARGN